MNHYWLFQNCPFLVAVMLCCRGFIPYLLDWNLSGRGAYHGVMMHALAKAHVIGKQGVAGRFEEKVKALPLEVEQRPPELGAGVCLAEALYLGVLFLWYLEVPGLALPDVP